MRTPTRAGCRFRAAAAPRRNAACRRGHRHLHVRDRATRHPQAAWPDEDIVLRQHGRQTPTLAPLSRVPDSESRSSSSTPVSTARSHACLRATRHGQCAARKAPRVPPAPATAGSSGAARHRESSVQYPARHHSWLCGARTAAASDHWDPGPRWSHPAAGSGSAARDEVPRRGVGKRRVEQVPAASRPLGQAGILRGHDARRHEDRQLGFAQLIATRRKQSPSTGTSSNPGKPLTSRPARATESHR